MECSTLSVMISGTMRRLYSPQAGAGRYTARHTNWLSRVDEFDDSRRSPRPNSSTQHSHSGCRPPAWRWPVPLASGSSPHSGKPTWSSRTGSHQAPAESEESSLAYRDAARCDNRAISRGQVSQSSSRRSRLRGCRHSDPPLSTRPALPQRPWSML